MVSLKQRKMMELKYSLMRSWPEQIWHQSTHLDQSMMFEMISSNTKSLQDGVLELPQSLDLSNLSMIFMKMKDFLTIPLKLIMQDKSDASHRRSVQNQECLLKVQRKLLDPNTILEIDLRNKNHQSTRSAIDEIKEHRIV